jgi:hypothetical protein
MTLRVEERTTVSDLNELKDRDRRSLEAFIQGDTELRNRCGPAATM